MTRSPRSTQGGYSWTVTFVDRNGDIPTMWVSGLELHDSYSANGGQHKGFLKITNRVHGTELAGSFALAYGGETTPSLAFDAGAAAVHRALESLGTVGTGGIVSVQRGVPDAQLGYTWTVTFAGDFLPDWEGSDVDDRIPWGDNDLPDIVWVNASKRPWGWWNPRSWNATGRREGKSEYEYVHSTPRSLLRLASAAIHPNAQVQARGNGHTRRGQSSHRG